MSTEQKRKSVAEILYLEHEFAHDAGPIWILTQQRLPKALHPKIFIYGMQSCLPDRIGGRFLDFSGRVYMTAILFQELGALQ